MAIGPGYRYNKKTGAKQRINPLRSRIAKKAFKHRRLKHPTAMTRRKIARTMKLVRRRNKTVSGRRTKYIM